VSFVDRRHVKGKVYYAVNDLLRGSEVPLTVDQMVDALMPDVLSFHQAPSDAVRRAVHNLIHDGYARAIDPAARPVEITSTLKEIRNAR
jgi:hypothetical protein